MPDILDSQLTFYMQVCRDQREAQWALKQLRKHYPAARLLIVSDGDNDPRWPGIARRFGGEYLAGQTLYDTQQGGRILQRMLDLYMQAPTDYLFKIDTDTWTHRRFSQPPTGRCVFGTLEWFTFGKREPLAFPNVQGGCVGYTHQAAQSIWASEVLLDPRLSTEPTATYADCHEIRLRAEQGQVSTDFLLRYACRELRIPCEEWGEVRSKYRGWISRDPHDRYAFTHPHKELASRHPAAHRAVACIPLQIQNVARAVKRGLFQPVGSQPPRPVPATED